MYPYLWPDPYYAEQALLADQGAPQARKTEAPREAAGDPSPCMLLAMLLSFATGALVVAHWIFQPASTERSSSDGQTGSQPHLPVLVRRTAVR
jgi:hypothetical protein